MYSKVWNGPVKERPAFKSKCLRLLDKLAKMGHLCFGTRTQIVISAACYCSIPLIDTVLVD